MKNNVKVERLFERGPIDLFRTCTKKLDKEI